MVALNCEEGIFNKGQTVLIAIDKTAEIRLERIILAIERRCQIIPCKIFDSVPTLDWRTVDTQTATHTKVLIEEESTLSTYRCRSAKLKVEHLIAIKVRKFKIRHVEVQVART